MKHPAFSILLYLALASCGQDSENLLRPDRINYAVDYRQGLKVAAADTLILETSHTDITVYPNEMAGMKMLTEIYPRDTMKYIPAVLKKYAWGCDYY